LAVILVIVADSVRADAFGCTGGPATPVVDSLAGEGIVFERTITAAPWTVPSFAAMVTGIYSHRLGLAKWEQPWPRDARTIFDVARDAGLETGSFVFDPRFMFCHEPRAAVVGSSQETGALLEWLRAHRGRPCFVLVHYWWTHIPYIARPMSTKVWHRMTDRVLAALRASPQARDGVERLYGHAVRHFSERWLPEVLDAVDLDTTWIFVTADHGESFGERGGPESVHDVFDLHGNALFDEVLRVPLIVRPPGGGPARRVGGCARTVDLMPTVADVLGRSGTPDLDALDGRSLLPCILDGRDAPAPEAVSVMNRDVLRAPELPSRSEDLWTGFALTTAAGKKLIWNLSEGRRSAFDLTTDPGETTDLADGPGDAFAGGWERLSAELARARVGELTPTDADLLHERLRALGYLDE
jgi:hypothetical protein